MLVYATIAVKDLCLSYDSSDQIKDIIMNKDEYKTLALDIKRNGVLDPLLVNQYEDRLQVETGGQRLMLARGFEIEYIKAFVYPKNGAIITCQNTVSMTSLDQIKSYFRSEDIATYLDIEGYVKSGHIQLETDS